MAMYALLPICCFFATYTVLAPTRSAPRFALAYDAVMRMQDVRHAPVALAASKSVDSPAPSGSTRRSDRSVRFAPSRAILVVCVCACFAGLRRAVRHVGIRKFMPGQTFALSFALCRCRLMAHRASHCWIDLSGLVCSTLEQKGRSSSMLAGCRRCLRDGRRPDLPLMSAVFAARLLAQFNS
jgi:hypothetical protein